MGYRQYFYEVDISIVNGIRKCKTEEELYDFCIKNSKKIANIITQNKSL